MSQFFGKIPEEGLGQLILPHLGHQRGSVRQGPAFGVDVSVVDIGGGTGLAMTSDPLSLIPSLGLAASAWLSVHLMANDMATTGFAPMYAQMVLNLPPTMSQHDLDTYWSYIHQYCKTIGVAITGGHTGSIEGQNSTIAGGGTMLLTAPLDQLLLSNKAQAGDKIIVTKGCAISSAAILAMSFPHTVQNELGAGVYHRCCDLFERTSSLTDALTAAATGQVRAMHDVTEGGVLGAIYEMALASGLGLQVHNELLPVDGAVAELTRLFNIDPRFCIGAGAMVIAVKPGGETDILNALQHQNIDGTVVGEFTTLSAGRHLMVNGEDTPMPYHGTDAYWEAFFNALKLGWK